MGISVDPPLSTDREIVNGTIGTNVVGTVGVSVVLAGAATPGSTDRANGISGAG
jgi:hypothetical protein